MPSEAERNVGHGHVFPRPDGREQRCGGPALCPSCAEQNTLKAGYTDDLFAAQAVARGRLTALLALLRAEEPVGRPVVLEHLDLALADLRPPEEPEVREAAPVLDERVHSRRCGIQPHGHGRACHADCPTCHGEDE